VAGQKKVIVITGATSGIGLEMAKALDREDHRLILGGRSRKKAAIADKEFRKSRPHWILGDLRKKTTRAAFKRSVGRRLEILFINAGEGYYGHISTTPDKVYADLMDSNFFSAVSLTKVLLPAMGRGSTIIFTGSAAGISGYPGETAYSPTKFAIHGFAECLKFDLLGKGVSVHLLAPPATRTDFFRHPSWKKFPKGRHRGELDPRRPALAGIGLIHSLRFMTIPSWRSRIILGVRRVSVSMYLWLLSRFIK